MTGCECEACKALAAEYATDPELLRYYQRKLLVRGWAGDKSAVERAYILAHAPFAQSAARNGAANIAQNRFSGVEPAPTDAPGVEMALVDLEAISDTFFLAPKEALV